MDPGQGGDDSHTWFLHGGTSGILAPLPGEGGRTVTGNKRQRRTEITGNTGQ